MLEDGASLAHPFQELGQGGSSQGKCWQWQDLCLPWGPCLLPQGHLGHNICAIPTPLATHLMEPQSWQPGRSWDEGSVD